jgi:PRTRC genetic system protein E
MTASEPIRLTPQMVERMYREHCPEKVERFKEVNAALQDPAVPLETRRAKLQELLQYRVEVEELKGGVFYRWEGARGIYQLEIAMPFEPNRRPNGNGAAQPPLAASQESQEAQRVPSEESSKNSSSAQSDPARSAASLQEDASLTAGTKEEMAEQMKPLSSSGGDLGGVDPRMETSTAGLFTALAELLGDTTLLMSISRTGDEQGQPVLIVNVVPKGEGDTAPFTPLSLEGTVSELDAHFLTAIQSKAESRKRLEEAIAEEKEADRALADAKKQEAEVKKKQAEAKKKSAEKKEEQVRVEEKKAEAAKQQEALF